jgi:hypothetical protein
LPQSHRENRSRKRPAKAGGYEINHAAEPPGGRFKFDGNTEFNEESKKEVLGAGPANSTATGTTKK